MKLYSGKHIGEKHDTSCGPLEITGPGSRKGYCMVTFNNPKHTMEACYGRIISGHVKNPMFPAVNGVGCIGVGKYGATTLGYITWVGMMGRCYGKTECNAYDGVTVNKEWFDFQNFARWFKSQPQGGLELDKDLLSRGNKEYGPDVCLMLPRSVNSFIAKRRPNNITGYIGVMKSGDKYRGRCTSFANGKRLYGPLRVGPYMAWLDYEGLHLSQVYLVRDLLIKLGYPIEVAECVT